MKRAIAIVFVTLFVVSGCSVKTAYNNLDRLVRWGVSDYVDLNDEQKATLNREIRKFRYWHRIHHLPLYAEFTNGLATVMTDTVSVAQMRTMFDQMTIWVEEIEVQVTPLIIDMMVSLTDEQVAELPGHLEESNIEIAEPELGVALSEAQEEWADEVEDGLRRFVGRLTDTQKDYIARRSTGYQPERVLWAEYRRRFQADLLALLEIRTDRTAFAEGYRKLVAARESYYGDELTERFDHNEALGMDVAAYVLSDLNERQRDRFIQELTELGEDFTELAAQSERDAPEKS